jgi:hypothetical protein
MFLLALLLAGANTTISGDFDRDGRQDRVVAQKEGDHYKVMLYRSFGDNKVVETRVPMSEGFTIKKVPRGAARATVCAVASLSRYACDAGDVLQYGNDVTSAMAIWNGQRFIVYRPQTGSASEAATPDVPTPPAS